MICEQPDSFLALTVRLLVYGSGDGAFLKMRRHFSEKIGRNQLYFACKSASAKRAANRKTINGIHINSRKLGHSTKQFDRLLEGFLLIFMSFDDFGDAADGAMPRESFHEAVGFFSMVFGAQHARNDRYFRSWGNQFAH